MSTIRRAVSTVLTLAATTLALAGCSSTTSTSPGGPGGAGGRGMMGEGTGVALSERECSAPEGLAGTTVRITLSDMGMRGTRGMMQGNDQGGARMALRPSVTRVPAGQVSLVAVNQGWRTHELVVLPLGRHDAVGERVPGTDGRVDETGALGEASKSCGPDSGEGLKAGTTGWTTLTLGPGRYELVCNLKNHYAAGMRGLLVVT